MLLASAPALCQTVVDPRRIPESLRRFEPRPGEEALHCELTPLKPALDFTFRFQSVFFVKVPLALYAGSGHFWTILIRAIPDGGEPVYFRTNIRLPEIPKTKVEAEIGGGFVMGEGRYDVQWLLADDSGRVCRKKWSVNAQLGHGERNIRVALPPHTADGFFSSKARDVRANRDDAAPFRLTVLLDAAPLSLRRTTLRASDSITLVGLLSSLLERLPARSVRLVVFNLDQRKEVFRQDPFARSALDRVMESINDLQLGVVDYHVLQNRRGHIEFLADLINQELEAPKPSDAVVFLGSSTRYLDKLPPAALRTNGTSAPRFFYLQYRPYWRRTSTFPDIITQALHTLRGKTLAIHSPAEFARAIEQVEHVAAPRPAPETTPDALQ
jgi:hypothetical protein